MHLSRAPEFLVTSLTTSMLCVRSGLRKLSDPACMTSYTMPPKTRPLAVANVGYTVDIRLRRW